MSTVRIPPGLRAQAESNKQVEIDGETVDAVIVGLVRRFPGLRDQFYTESGELSPVHIYLNGRAIRDDGGLATPVKPTDVVVVLRPMAGG